MPIIFAGGLTTVSSATTISHKRELRCRHIGALKLNAQLTSQFALCLLYHAVASNVKYNLRSLPSFLYHPPRLPYSKNPTTAKKMKTPVYTTPWTQLPIQYVVYINPAPAVAMIGATTRLNQCSLFCLNIEQMKRGISKAKKQKL